MLNVAKIRKDFPILKREVHGKKLVYLDNAATTQKPLNVIEATSHYYSTFNANVHRGVHKLSEEATEMYDKAHEKVAKFIGGKTEEIVFTKNATEALNIPAYSLGLGMSKQSSVVTTEMEHHSNFVPWQQMCIRTGAKFRIADMTPDFELDIEQLKKKINSNDSGTKIVAVGHCSNALGTENPIPEIAEIAHDKGAVVVADGAQSVPHMPIDVKKLGVDMLAFSGHKMLGPTGIGVLWGKAELLEEMTPFIYGGDMILEVKRETTRFNDIPWKFEAGTPNIAGAAGLTAAIEYLECIGMEEVHSHVAVLGKKARTLLQENKDIELYSSPKQKSGIASFNVKNIHAHDVAAMLDFEGIAIRGGHHCAMPLMHKLGISGTARASFYIYNTAEEAENLAAGIKETITVFNK